jgi:hypothetical protein
MLAELILLLALVAVLAAWFAGRAASEAAVHHGREACHRAGVQWLDQSVHLLAMRLRRGEDGWLGIERHYGFEYSLDGDDRHAGRVVMHGRRLRSLLGPLPRAEVT